MSKDIQLFLFPYAGGSIASFKRLTDLIEDHVDVITVEYPGRGTRAKDQLSTSFADLLEDAIAYCQSRRDITLPYAVMGYSMGGILAYEILSRRAMSGMPKQ